MLRYYITDSQSLGGADRLIENIQRIIGERLADRIQIREKHLPPRDLLRLTRRVVQLAEGSGIDILVNTRLDAALAGGAHGVHLPSGLAPVAEWRRIAPPGFLIGVSCHDSIELTAAQTGGADFAVLSPVFSPLSKTSEQGPLGIARFGLLTQSVAPLPVLALGGITLQHIPEIAQAGGAGIAGISLFQR